jgi:hypothetical protein
MRSSHSSRRGPHVPSEPPPRWLRHTPLRRTRQSLDPRSPDVPSLQRRCLLGMLRRRSPPLAAALTKLLRSHRRGLLPCRRQVPSRQNRQTVRTRQIHQAVRTRQPHHARRRRCRVSHLVRPPTPEGRRQPGHRRISVMSTAVSDPATMTCALSLSKRSGQRMATGALREALHANRD